STARLDTLKVAQIIGIQTILLGASNSFAIHEDMEQLGFDIGLRMDQIWTLSKAQALESISQGKKLDVICTTVGIPSDKFEDSKLAESMAALIIKEEARDAEKPTVMVSRSSDEDDI
ncbi:hypothetical protein KI387_035887, partial [Taxus chinensis]